ncbi:MAG: hypothetical protein KF852_17950 [Saprospiraceae bacterium]|nr:hypothetical protein [Saprospiraceae bacterium]
MRRAYIFPADTPVAEKRRAWFRESGVELLPWPGTAAAGEVQAVLLAGPVRCSNGQFVHPEGVWRRFLAKNHPAARLIQIGLRHDLAGPNYMHWFDPPADFGVFWQAAQSVTDMELPPPIGFTTLAALWKKFWDGHDKGGFFYYFSWAKLPVLAALDNVEESPEEWLSQKNFLESEAVPQRFQNCRHRWAHYKPYWEAAPFAGELAALERELTQLHLDTTTMTDSAATRQQLSELKKHLQATESTLETLHSYFTT